MDQADYLKELASSLLKYRRERFLCDFVVIAADEREVYAHTAIMATASNKLKAAFEQQKLSKRLLYFRLTINECDVTAVEAVMQFIYTGTLPHITSLQPQHVTAVLMAGQKLGLDVSKLALILSAFVSLSEPGGFEFPPFVLTDEDMYLEVIERDQQPARASAIEIIKLTSKEQSNPALVAGSGATGAQDHSYNYPDPVTISLNDKNLTADVSSAGVGNVMCSALNDEGNGASSAVQDDFMTGAGNDSQDITVSCSDNDVRDLKTEEIDDCSSVVIGEYENDDVLQHQNDILYNVVDRDLVKSVSAVVRSSTGVSKCDDSTYEVIEDMSFLSNLLGAISSRSDINSGGVSVKEEPENQGGDVLSGAEAEIGIEGGIPADPSSLLGDPVGMSEVIDQQTDGMIDSRRVKELKPGIRFTSAVGLSGFKRRGRPIGSGRGGLIGSIARQRVILICDQCGKSFQRSKEYTEHRRTHTGERPFSCDLCGKAFSRRRTMTEHRRLHTGDRRYACDICDKKFPTSGELVKHRRFHTGERPYQCDICGKTFSRCGENADHRRMHAGELTCRLCNKDFTRLHNMKEHMNSAHGGEKRFACTVCGKCFAYSSGLRYHRRLHIENRPFVCQLCGKGFARAGELGRHERSTHKSQIVEIEVYS